MTTHSNSLAITVSPSGLKPGPWRITFDTNPDDCNLHCIMCEDHSPFSTTQPDRLSAGLPKRRMDIELIRRVLADSVGTSLREIIPSTMGEPLLYRDFDQDDCKVRELDRRGGRWSALGGRRKSWLAGAGTSGLETILPGAGRSDRC